MLRYGWQLDATVWSRVSPDLVTSQEWRYVGYSEDDAASVPSDSAGVYLICVYPLSRLARTEPSPNDLFSKFFAPIYIGRTDNLRRRFIEHCRRPSPKVRDARKCFGSGMQFWFHRLEVGRIAEEEAVLIRCFGPTANDRQEAIRATLGTGVAIGVHREGKSR